MGKSLNYKEAIKETVSDLSSRIRKERNSTSRDYLRFLLSLKDGSNKSQSKAASMIGLGVRQGQKIWSKYKKGGLALLLERKTGGAPCKLTVDQEAELQEVLKDGKTQFLKQGVHLIAQKYGKTYTTPGVHFLFKRLGIKKKTGRPSNIRQDKEGLENFKKTLVS